MRCQDSITRRIRRFWAPFVVALLALSWVFPGKAVANEEPIVLHVAVSGNDDNPGTAAQPLRTLTAARDAVRALPRDSRPIVVQLAGGRYQLDQSFRLETVDSGSPGAPITYRATPGEKVIITGAQPVPEDAARAVQDEAVRARLDPRVADRVRQIDLRALGLTDLGSRQPEVTGADRPTGVHLIQGDVQGHDARYPNAGQELTISAVRADGDRPVWQIDDPVPFSWNLGDSDLWVEGFPGFDWAYQVQQVVDIDAAASTITLGTASEFGSRAGQPFHFVHVLEGLDQPDEFFVDTSTGLLYFLPTGAPLSVTRLADPLVVAADTSYVGFEGLDFDGSRGDAVRMTGGRGLRIVDSSFTNLGLRAIRLAGVTDSLVDSVRISHVGSGGVDMQGGDRTTLAPGGNVVSNSRIEHFAQTYPRYSPGILLGGVGNVARNNEISNSPHLAVQIQGNDHTFEANYVHDVVLEGSDSGALYGGRDWTERGNVVANNVFARVGSGAHDVSAVYLDDMMSGTEVRQNVIVDSAVGVQHNGRNNKVSSNIFVRNERPVYVGNWSQAVSGPGGELEQRLRAVPYRSPAWAKYPNLADLLDDEPSKQKYNTVESNALIASGDMSFDEAAEGAVTARRNRSLPPDAIVTGPDLMDFLIPADSPVRQVPGMRLPDLARIGPGEQGPPQPPITPGWGFPLLVVIAVGSAAGLIGAALLAWRVLGRRQPTPTPRRKAP